MRAIRFAALLLSTCLSASPALAADDAATLAKKLADADAGVRASAASALWTLAGCQRGRCGKARRQQQGNEANGAHGASSSCAPS